MGNERLRIIGNIPHRNESSNQRFLQLYTTSLITIIIIQFHSYPIKNEHLRVTVKIIDVYNKDRIAWLDWARAFAIISVVVCHSTEAVFNIQLSEWMTYDHDTQLISLFLFTFGRLGVPVFLFLSGFLILQRHPIKNWDDLRDFILKRWIPLFVCIEIWNLIYFAYFCLAGYPYTLEDLFSWVTFQIQTPFSHWWYMLMILGVYLVIPVISILRESFGSRFILIATILYFIWFVIRPLTSISIKIDLNFLGDSYVLYILYGYCCYLYRDRIKEILDRKIVMIAIWIASIIMYCYCVEIQIESLEAGKKMLIWYNSPYLIVTSMLLFQCFTIFSKTNIVATIISIYSFAIYLIHNIILYTLKDNMFHEVTLYYFFIFLIVSLLLSLIIAIILSNSKTLSKLLFLIKSKPKFGD